MENTFDNNGLNKLQKAYITLTDFVSMFVEYIGALNKIELKKTLRLTNNIRAGAKVS